MGLAVQTLPCELPGRATIEPLPTIAPGRRLHSASAALPAITAGPVQTLDEQLEEMRELSQTAGGMRAIATALPTMSSAAATGSSNGFHLVTLHSSQSSTVQSIAPTMQLSEIIAKPATTSIADVHTDELNNLAT